MAEVEIIKANLKTEKEEIVNYNTKRVCAYCRVSTDSEEQQTSYNSQLSIIVRKLNQHQIGNL